MDCYDCDYCGKTFILSYNQRYKLKKGLKQKAFCNRECYVKSISGPTSPYWKSGAPVKGKCSYCEKEFILSRQQRTSIRHNRAKRLYCSHECHLKDMMENKPHNWKGGRVKRSNGYIAVLVPDHPFATNGYVLEHRLVMEHMLGRYLTPEECIHHVNGIRSDNRPENLLLMRNNAEHSKLHAIRYRIKQEGICPTCGKTFNLSKHQRYYQRIGQTKESYCSNECYAKSLDSRMEMQCAYCKKAFLPTPSQWWKHKTGITKQVFCNRECADQYKRDKRKVS